MGRIALPARTSKPCLPLPSPPRPRRWWLPLLLARREQEASSCPPRSPRQRSLRPRRPRSPRLPRSPLPRRPRSRQRRQPSQRPPRSLQPRRQRSLPRRPPPRRSKSSASNLIVHHYSFFYLFINHHGLH